MATVLICDDDPGIRQTLRYIFKRAGHEVVDIEDGRQAVDLVREAPSRFDVAILDLRMPGISGLECLGRLKQVAPDLPVMMLTAFSDWDNTVEAMRLGAYDYLKKPFNNEEIIAVVERAVVRRKLSQEARGRPELPEFREFIGNSQKMRAVLDLVVRVAPTEATVLIQGESGTGKELIARALHYLSPRAAEPFITVNCGAFPETLIESELFGHAKGAFTGAFAEKKGLLAVADRGTFFLDEIGEMPLLTQAKLLRVLEERAFIPVGATRSVQVDVRFVCATNRDLAEEVRHGRFRSDLFYRLNVIPLRLPPLRERPGDIPLLAGFFMRRYARNLSREIKGFSPLAQAKLERYTWPGNVRELENAIQRAIALGSGPQIEDVTLGGDFAIAGGFPGGGAFAGAAPGAMAPAAPPGSMIPGSGSAAGYIAGTGSAAGFIPGTGSAAGYIPGTGSVAGVVDARSFDAGAGAVAPAGEGPGGRPLPSIPPGTGLPRIVPSGFDLERTLEAVERGYLEQALVETEGNLTRAAELLGISFRSIRYKVKKLGIRNARGGEA
jgi:two-component system response regulator PilR (NtrC family)